MRKSTYNYVSPTVRGYQLQVLSRREKKALLKRCGYKKHLWAYRPEKFVNDAGETKVQVFSSTPLKVLNTLFIPLSLLVHGLSNWKEVIDEVKRSWNERERGSFVEHTIRVK